MPKTLAYHLWEQRDIAGAERGFTRATLVYYQDYQHELIELPTDLWPLISSASRAFAMSWVWRKWHITQKLHSGDCKALSFASFCVAVVGDFNRWKSTFINALLGKAILPADVLPASTTLNRVTYGLEPSAKLRYKDPVQGQDTHRNGAHC